MSPLHVATSAPARATAAFHFTLPLPLAEAAPFFGPEGERCWAGPRWDPQFAWPQPARDTEGMVFTITHAGHTSIWVNTLFDLAQGRMTYVSVTPSLMASVIDVRLTELTPQSTRVEVTYTRTALDSAANDEVLTRAEADRTSGPEWQQAIEACIARR